MTTINPELGRAYGLLSKVILMLDRAPLMEGPRGLSIVVPKDEADEVACEAAAMVAGAISRFRPIEEPK